VTTLQGRSLIFTMFIIYRSLTDQNQMKKLKAFMIAALLMVAGGTFAQTATPATTPAKKEIKTKKDGTPDKRYSENQKLKKDGTPDRRYNENKNLKKDGTPDKRFKTSKADSLKAAKKKK
jgi:hypothetical protein